MSGDFVMGGVDRFTSDHRQPFFKKINKLGKFKNAFIDIIYILYIPIVKFYLLVSVREQN